MWKPWEWPRGWRMSGPRAVQNLQMPHPRDWQGVQMPRSSGGVEGPGRRWNWLMHNLSYANCFLGLTYGVLNKTFQEINLFISHWSFLALAQKTTVLLQIVRFWETFRRNLSWIKTEMLFLYMFRIELLFIFLFITCHSRISQSLEFLHFCSVQCAALFL